MREILFVTHQLSLSGAPMVLMDMIRVCVGQGFYAEVISLTEGPLSDELDRMGIPWRVQSDFLAGAKDFLFEVQRFGLVVVNTLVAYQPIFIMKHTRIPTIWWLHETEWYFETYDRMPDITPGLKELPDHIRILSVSPLVQDILQRRYGIETQVFPFCVADLECDGTSRQQERRGDRVRFLTLATWSAVKGQDVLAEAIRLLPSDIREKCEFMLCGGELEQEPGIKQNIEKMLSDIPQVSLYSAIPHEEAAAVMADSDYCIIPSREEPFSAVTVEAMSLRKPCILTDICGVASWLKDGENAFLCPPGDPQGLCDRICEAVELRFGDPGRYEQIGSNARAVYDGNFSPEMFRRQLMALLEELGVA